MAGASSVRVRRAVAGDGATVRLVRLLALNDAPDAFESTLELELALAPAEWELRISRSATFLAEDSDGPRGIVVGEPNWNDPKSVFLVSMWVDPASRGTDIANRLVVSVLSWAKAEHASGVWLHVAKENDRARRCYERNGFRATGQEIVRDRGGLLVEMHRHLDGGG